jgi:hypothetical protein
MPLAGAVPLFVRRAATAFASAVTMCRVALMLLFDALRRMMADQLRRVFPIINTQGHS